MAQEKTGTTHEDYSRSLSPEGPSDRSFGFTMAAVFLVIAAWPIIFHDGSPRSWALIVAGLFAVASTAWPSLLSPLNHLWLRFGLLLHRIVSPIILALLFYLSVWPTGMVLRLIGKRPLDLELEPESNSYWTEWEESSRGADHMEMQF